MTRTARCKKLLPATVPTRAALGQWYSCTSLERGARYATTGQPECRILRWITYQGTDLQFRGYGDRPIAVRQQLPCKTNAASVFTSLVQRNQSPSLARSEKRPELRSVGGCPDEERTICDQGPGKTTDWMCSTSHSDIPPLPFELNHSVSRSGDKLRVYTHTIAEASTSAEVPGAEIRASDDSWRGVQG